MAAIWTRARTWGEATRSHRSLAHYRLDRDPSEVTARPTCVPAPNRSFPIESAFGLRSFSIPGIRPTTSTSIPEPVSVMKSLLFVLLAFVLPLQPAHSQSPTAGRALVFQGTGSVSIRHQPELNPYPMTATAWVRTSQTSGFAGLVNKYLSGAFCGWQMYLINGEIRAWYFADFTNHIWDGSDGLNGGFVADGRWHHLAFAVDDTGGTIYVDGVARANRAWNGTPTRTAGIQDMNLGSYPGAALNLFRGSMDEVTLWNVRLPQATLANLYTRSLRGDEAGLVAYYRFDESEGSLIQDSCPAGGHNAGVVSGTVARALATTPLVPSAPTNGLPVIVRNPENPEIEAGSPVAFTVQDPAGTWNYQWLRGGVEIPSATNAQFALAAVSAGDSGDYSVRSWNDTRTLVSPPTALRVITVPELVTQPVGEVGEIGGSVSFSPRVIGGRPLEFRWFRDGVLVGRSNSLTLSPVEPSHEGDYRMVASNSHGSVTSAVARLRISARPLTNRLVLHLTFDGRFQDDSGRGNHAAYARSGPNANASPTFVAGRIGQAFQFTTTSDGNRFEYATLGYPPDLRLGAEDDFSVSFWINYQNQTGDLPFLSNKDWDKSHKPGWAITTQGGGHFRVNASGPNRGADFFTTATTPVIRDGRWHHLLICFQRTDGNRSAWVHTYVDGNLVNRTAMSLSGEVDTFGLPFSYASPRTSLQSSWALNIGQDGTGVYFDKGGASAIGARIDDLGIWRRALNAGEVRAIYTTGLAGLDLSKAVVVPKLFLVPEERAVRLFWSGDPRNRLEVTSDLSSGVWSAVPGVSDTNTTTLNVADLPGLFRLVR